MSTRKPSLILPMAAVVAGLLVAYTAAYYAMVVPSQIDLGLGPAADGPDANGMIHVETLLNYRVEGLEAFFVPIHWLDRRARPDVWTWSYDVREADEEFDRQESTEKP